MSQQHPISRSTTHLVETQPFGLATPYRRTKEVIERLGCVPESGQILTQDNHDVWAYSLGLADELKLFQPSFSSLVVARDHDVLLLHGEG